jgi:DNA-binding beta-propeller fold protein YncE
MRARLALLILGAFALAGCGTRPRANPFDPHNPGTQGRPSGFVALAADREVRMRWDAVTGSFIGFEIQRRGPGETDYRPIATGLSPSLTAFRDVPVLNGADYDYRLYFVFLSGRGNLPAEDSASPGAARPWLIESGGTALLRATPDNRHVLDRRSGYSGTSDVAVNPAIGDVWVTDEGAGRLVIYQGDTGVTLSVPGFQRPVAVAVDRSNSTGWVCDIGTGRVRHVRRDGGFESIDIGPLNQPVDAAVDPFFGSVWVCELGANRVLFHDDVGAFQWSVTVPGPSRVAVDSTTHEAWVTSFDFGTVTRISPGGQVLDVVPNFVAPLGVSVDSRRGVIWVADPLGNRVVALDRTGGELFRVNGLTDAGEISVDVTTGEAWAVLGSAGSVARISPAGTVIRTQGGFDFPYAISVDPGGR